MERGINVAQALASYPVSRRSLYFWMANGDVEWWVKPGAAGRQMNLEQLERRVFRRRHRKQLAGPGHERCGVVDQLDNGPARRCVLIARHDQSINSTPHLFEVDDDRATGADAARAATGGDETQDGGAGTR